MTLYNAPYMVGSGARKVICLNGWFGYAHGWGAFVECLDGDQFTYVFMDYRGYGARKGSGGPYTAQQMAEDVVSLADQLGWPAFALMGHGMGGSVAQTVLIDNADRVQALVAIAPSPPISHPLDEKLWSYHTSAVTDVYLRRNLIDESTGRRLSDVWLYQMAQTSMLNSDQQAFAAYLDVWFKTDFFANLASKPTPVLVVAGAHDAMLSTEYCNNTWLKYYPNAELKVLANAGRYPMNEVPAELASMTEDFLHHHMPR